ncbi:uroporphyrinogen-III C-methyltransferase [Stieleria sp. TO1_6]|uniref:uroporphyrinogen-III C-methyltransferase n=1 Tax=Stieleria tagensis TaxID=2956795 RepID=UPI00209B580C|nr:uroporphyrinogen-III C-methyltransferase [Stieleria tagensis]MCO8121737.1 uroporphyrinogen-III C-methyltransferase [Stieleria tagensis]
MKPVVYLIGAGPGDPELMTLRGASCLRRCDVVLYDGLSNSEILRLAPTAQHICVGKHGHSRIWSQQEIIDEMLGQARSGKTVVRLKGGDPAVFARTAEEVDALVEAEIPFEIVPGITAALAAGSYAGIPITHRELASAVALVTGHEQPGKTQSALDWDALAKFPGTLVIYMGVTTAKVWTDALITAGKDPATPTALVRRCSHPDQSSIHCRLDEVADRLTPPSRFRPPVIAIVGPVTTLAKSMDWVSKRPLQGQSILVTRPLDQSDSMADAIRDVGGYPVIAPGIEIQPLTDFSLLDQAIENLSSTGLLIFCSANGVDHFFHRLRQLDFDARALAGVKIAVIGSKTDQALTEHGLRADFVPTDFRARSLPDCLRDWDSNGRVLIVRASRGSDELPNRLKTQYSDVQEVVAYQNVDVAQADPTILDALSSGQISWVTVTSSATARNLHRLYGDALTHCRLAAISPVTAQTLAELGLTVAAVADPYTSESLVHEIVKQS